MSTPDVESCETLYRQIPPGGDPLFIDPSAYPCVHPSRFHPTKMDTDGLSLIRARFRSREWAAQREQQPEKQFKIVPVNARASEQIAAELELNDYSFLATADVLDDKHGEPWAHCVATDINNANFQKGTPTRPQIKEWAIAVAKQIKYEEIMGPFPRPTCDSTYRPTDV